MAQPNPHEPTPRSDAPPPPSTGEPQSPPEPAYFLYPRFRRVSPQHARARNQSWVVLGGIVLGTIVVFAVAAWLWQTLGTAA